MLDYDPTEGQINRIKELYVTILPRVTIIISL